ncbi:MAG: hypothetical protein KTR31_35175, partial [Myxococcales bacterium]|nr:hypothetical protein [Myxococcales bacterium]
VSSGYRVVLTFTLQVESARLRPVPNTDRIEHLRASLARYFRLSDGDWLVHLLQHQYSEQGIDWGRLKNGDRTRAEALRRVARDLDCVCFLALADAVEGYDYHGPDLSVDDGEEDDDPSVPAWVALAGPLRSEPTWWSLTWPRPPLLPEMMAWPGGLLCIEEPPEVDKGIGTYCGREVTLRTWIDERGERCVGPEEEVSDGSIVLVEERHDWASYSASADPWRGNEGGVASKWFRVTAIVVVPRDTWDPFEQEPAPDTPPAPRRILRRRAGQG